jgi:RNA polymerase primary sigma factor
LKKLNIHTPLIADETLTIYLSQIARYKPLSTKEEAELAAKIRKGDVNALDKLVRSNLRFVVSVARNYQNQGLPLNDLINEGNLGLISAAKRFDEKKNFKFISYAVWWIRQAILQCLANNSRLVRLPLNRVAMVYKLGKTSADLEQKLNRLPNNREIAKEIGVSENNVTRSMKAGLNHTSLDTPLNNYESGTYYDVIHNKSVEKTDFYALRKLYSWEIYNLLQGLSKREKTVIRLYFGIGEETNYTLEEIGSRFNLTRERIRQIKDVALSKLKRRVMQCKFSDMAI